MPKLAPPFAHRGFAQVSAALLIAAPAVAMDAAVLPYPTTTFAEGAKTASVSEGALTATITMENRPAISEYGEIPVLRIVVGGQLLKAFGVPSGFGFPETQAGIVEIDRANSGPEVYFTSYSGGAHCCTNVIVATETPAGWKAVDLGTFDGGPDFLQDVDNDGAMEVVTVDNRFLYTFDCYACSAAPLVIQTVRAGVGYDVTADPRFTQANQEWRRTLVENEDPANRWTEPGFLAGWVAASARIGEGAAAFAELTAHWDFAADEGEEWCLMNVDFDVCPPPQRKMLKFPERLKLFLEWTGYPLQ